MISATTDLSISKEEEPKHIFTSKISSPTKRTLNNKNYLADEALPNRNKPSLDGKEPSKVKVTSHKDEFLPISGPNVLKKDKARTLHPVSHNSTYVTNAFDGQSNSTGPQLKYGYFKPQQSSSRLSFTSNFNSNISPTRNQKAGNGRPKNARCKEKNDASSVPGLGKSQKQRIISARYFSPPLDLQRSKRIEGRLKPSINVTPSNSRNSTNHMTYKLTVPLLAADKHYKVVRDQVETVYRRKYNEDQPLNLFGDESIVFGSLEEMDSKIKEYLQKMKKVNDSSQIANRTLNAIPSLNESFELSFDGKAMDRSDIFRMVDSFSVALSDEEELEEEINADVLKANKMLPEEISSSVF